MNATPHGTPLSVQSCEPSAAARPLSRQKRGGLDGPPTKPHCQTPSQRPDLGVFVQVVSVHEHGDQLTRTLGRQPVGQQYRETRVVALLIQRSSRRERGTFRIDIHVNRASPSQTVCVRASQSRLPAFACVCLLTARCRWKNPLGAPRALTSPPPPLML